MDSVDDRLDVTVELLLREKLPETELPDLFDVVLAVLEPVLDVNEGPLSIDWPRMFVVTLD